MIQTIRTTLLPALLLSAGAIAQAGNPALHPGDLPEPAGNAGNISLFLAEVGIGENGCSAVILIQRIGGVAGEVSADYETVAGSATPGEDFSARAGTVVFGDGDGDTRAVQVDIADDTAAEGDEAFTLMLSNPQGGANLGPITETLVAIADNDSGDPIFAHGFEPVPTCPQ